MEKMNTKQVLLLKNHQFRMIVHTFQYCHLGLENLLNTRLKYFKVQMTSLRHPYKNYDGQGYA